MRHPLWAANSILVLICVAILIFIFFSRQDAPLWESLKPSETSQSVRQQASDINIRQIYENDIFGTYEKSFMESKQPEEAVPLPTPPEPKKVSIPEEPKPTFLQPLNISLKGIIYVVNDDTKNRATIVELKTKQERNYKVGDFIEDAQLIKIFNKKIILLRANGQQEVLYLRVKDAEHDPAYAIIDGWEHVAQPISENHLMISTREFTDRVKNLAQFIDLLDLTTAYQRGISTGCRIGNLKENSLGTYLGLRSGDIITMINTMPVTDTVHRFNIYKEIIAMHEGDTINVNLVRNGMPINLSYRLSDFLSTGRETMQGTTGEKVLHEHTLQKERMRSMEQKHKFAPTLKQLHDKERETIQRKSRSPSKNLTSLLAR